MAATEPKLSFNSIILGTIIFVIIFYVFCFDIAGVHGTSMEPTLFPGQKVLVNRMAYGLQSPGFDKYLLYWHTVKVGDIIVYDSPLDRKTVVKRCIAIEGTPIEILNGCLKVEGQIYTLRDGDIDILGRFNYVPENTILAIGDNTDRSVDSRTYGFISTNSIKGRVIGARGERKS